jgi:hypothetical protein
LTAQDWAVTGCLLFGLLGIVGGGGFWPHYLLQLSPMLAVAAGIAAAEDRTGTAMRGWATVTACSSAAAVVIAAVVYATVPGVSSRERIGTWLASSANRGDTGFVAYGNPSILETAELPSPYPYLWSLPMRTLDPDQARLRATLAGPDAPTWVVQVLGLDSWHIDQHELLAGLLASRYHLAATICGRDIWLRDDQPRLLAPVPDC